MGRAIAIVPYPRELPLFRESSCSMDRATAEQMQSGLAKAPTQF
jgi:hypothetical protein